MKILNILCNCNYGPIQNKGMQVAFFIMVANNLFSHPFLLLRDY